MSLVPSHAFAYLWSRQWRELPFETTTLLVEENQQRFKERFFYPITKSSFLYYPLISSVVLTFRFLRERVSVGNHGMSSFRCNGIREMLFEVLRVDQSIYDYNL